MRDVSSLVDRIINGPREAGGKENVARADKAT